MALVRLGAMSAPGQGRRERSYPMGMDATEDGAPVCPACRDGHGRHFAKAS
jgi:hypothetical protein